MHARSLRAASVSGYSRRQSFEAREERLGIRPIFHSVSAYNKDASLFELLQAYLAVLIQAYRAVYLQADGAVPIQAYSLEDEAISVRAFEPPAMSDERRQEIAGELKRYFAEVDASRKPASADEAGEVISEAMKRARPGYCPHQ